MSFSGRIALALFALMLTLGLVLEHPRSFAVLPPTHFGVDTVALQHNEQTP